MNRTIATLWRPAALTIVLTACALGIRDRAETRYIGPLAATDSARCPPSTGVLVMRDGKFTFAPDEGTWVLSGTVGTGTLAATRSRPTSDHRSFDTELQAKWTEAEASGTYTTPFCTYRLLLQRH